MYLIDTHCHIGDHNFPLDQTEVLAAAKAAGVTKMIAIGTNQTTSRQAVEFAKKHDNVWATVGVHPHYANQGMKFLHKIDFTNPKIVAIGEIGLDYFRDLSPRSAQQQVFRQQIELALDKKLPIIFHVREAYADFWPIVDSYEIKRAILHSFSDSWSNAKRALAKDWLIGINGIITFTKNPIQLEAYRKIPLERMVLETDAPFLSPKPQRGKTNQPAYVRHIAEFIARERGVTIEEVARLTSRNAESLFNINLVQLKP